MPGIDLLFDSDKIRGEWWSERLQPILRAVVLLAVPMVGQLGGRLKIVKIFGEGIYEGGCVADVALLGLPLRENSRHAAGAPRFEGDYYHARIVRELNQLWPFGEGDFETALLIGNRVRIRVPWNGAYRRDSLALASWSRNGAPARQG